MLLSRSKLWQARLNSRDSHPLFKVDALRFLFASRRGLALQQRQECMCKEELNLCFPPVSPRAPRSFPTCAAGCLPDKLSTPWKFLACGLKHLIEMMRSKPYEECSSPFLYYTACLFGSMNISETVLLNLFEP